MLLIKLRLYLKTFDEKVLCSQLFWHRNASAIDISDHLLGVGLKAGFWVNADTGTLLALCGGSAPACIFSEGKEQSYHLLGTMFGCSSELSGATSAVSAQEVSFLSNVPFLSRCST